MTLQNMPPLPPKAGEATELTQIAQNPSVNPQAASKDASSRKRIPMTVPLRSLEVPAIPGWHLHWFTSKRIPRALQAGYVFVKDHEVDINQKGVGTDKTVSGNADLGTNVCVVDGESGGEGKEPRMLTLMKIPEEYYQKDQAILKQRNAEIMGAIFRGEIILGQERERADDRALAYVDRNRTGYHGGGSELKPVFQRPTRK